MNVKIHAIMGDDFKVNLDIETNCPNITKIKDSLTTIDPMTEICQGGFANSEVYKWATGLPHVACPVPCAIIKAVEAASDMALQKPVSMEYQ